MNGIIIYLGIKGALKIYFHTLFYEKYHEKINFHGSLTDRIVNITTCSR